MSDYDPEVAFRICQNENARLRAQLTAEKARADDASGRAHGYAIELDTIYAALGTADAEGAPEAAVSIKGLFAELDQLMGRFNDVCSELNEARDERDAAIARETDVAIELQRIGVALGSHYEWSDHKAQIADVGHRFDAAQAEARELREVLKTAGSAIKIAINEIVCDAMTMRWLEETAASIDAALAEKDTPHV